MHLSKEGSTQSTNYPTITTQRGGDAFPSSLGIASICVLHFVPSLQPTNISAILALHWLLQKQLMIVQCDHVAKMAQRCTEHICLYPDKAEYWDGEWLWRSIKIRELSGIPSWLFLRNTFDWNLAQIPALGKAEKGSNVLMVSVTLWAFSYSEITPEDKVASYSDDMNALGLILSLKILSWIYLPFLSSA